MKVFNKIMLTFLIVAISFVTIGVSIFFLNFKKDYLDIVSTHCNQNNFDRAMAMSIIKAESKFNKNAKSTANAIGLMQIKLGTANYVLSLAGESEIDEQQLFEPETNIKIGVRYLVYLSGKFQSIETILCAYNAGETTVNNWLRQANYSTDGKTLDEIPYPETKSYVKKVMMNYKIYKKVFDI